MPTWVSFRSIRDSNVVWVMPMIDILLNLLLAFLGISNFMLALCGFSESAAVKGWKRLWSILLSCVSVFGGVACLFSLFLRV